MCIYVYGYINGVIQCVGEIWMNSWGLSIHNRWESPLDQPVERDIKGRQRICRWWHENHEIKWCVEIGQVDVLWYVMISHHFHVTALTMSWIKSWKISHRNRRICWSTRRITGYRMSDICVCFRGLHCDFGFSRTVCDSFRSTLSDAGHLASRRWQVWRCFMVFQDFCWYV